jgi:hypothetical protein
LAIYLGWLATAVFPSSSSASSFSSVTIHH